MSNHQVDAMKLLGVLQEKLRMKEDENSLLQARLLTAQEKIEELENRVNEKTEVQEGEEQLERRLSQASLPEEGDS